MLFKYNYAVGPQGVEFSIAGGGDALPVKGSKDDLAAIQRFIMRSWQDAINASSTPEEIRNLIGTREGQKTLAERAEAHLLKLLDSFPSDLDRRKRTERRKSARPGTRDRRRTGGSLQPA